ncbi:MAG: TIGR03790 family protein [Acidobacteriota bacterium]
MKAKRMFFPALFILHFVFTLAQARESYKDVAVVINVNSTMSENVGTYFAAQRMIPSRNVIRVNAPATEEITDAQFQDLRTQIESYLTSHQLTDSINYIVTTKGMPLKVNRGLTSDYNSPSSSVESELCLILGPYAGNIGKAGRVVSPYSLVQQNFSHTQFGIYLVTRLDGYTYGDIKMMIDNAALADSTVLQTGRFVFDMDPTRSMVDGTLNGNMAGASSALRAKSRLTVLDSSSVYLTGLSNVLGYVSWGSNDANAAGATDHAKPYHQFVRGSIAETYVSTSGRSFEAGTVYGQSLIADLIAEGVTGVKGYVYEPWSSAMANVQYAFPMYAEGFTFAESYYSAAAYLSWMDVLVGDPKMRIRTVRVPQSWLITDAESGSSALPVELVSFSGAQSGAAIGLAWVTATEVNNYGFEVERNTDGAWARIGFVEGSGTTNAAHEYAFIDRAPRAGRVSYRLKQIDRDGRSAYSNAIELAFTSAPVREFRLNRNYPNPFNPSTMLTFTVAKSGHAELKVYNIVGQEVAVLFSGYVEAGEMQTAVFNASGKPSGVYVGVLESAGSRMVQKMVLSK